MHNVVNFLKNLGSPTLNQSPTILKAFDGRVFHTYRILQDLPIEVEGKTVNLDVEFVDAPLDYNLILGHSWSYAMTVVISSIFRLIMFPHKGNIVKIDQLPYYSSEPASTNSIQHVGKSTIPYEDVGVGLVKNSTLMGTFSMPPPNVPRTISNINMISSSTIPFDDTWVVPSESKMDSFNGEMSLSPFEMAYVEVQSFYDTLSTNPDQMNLITEEYSSLSSSALTSISDPFQQVFHTDESIREFLSLDELPWDDLHHRSSFLPEFDRLENEFSSILMIDYVKEPHNPISIKNSDSEINLGNISTTVPIDISVKPRVLEKIHIGAS